MLRYATLTTFPADVRRQLKDFPALLAEASAKAAAATGCEVVGSHLTLGHGPYDHIGILNAPSEASITQWVNIGVAASGVDTTIVRLFTPDEAEALLNVGA